MYSNIDQALTKRAVKLEDEKPLAAGLGEGPVKDEVAARFDRHDRAGERAVLLAQRGNGKLGLRERERAIPRANP
jgi:hypothetical protein